MERKIVLYVYPYKFSGVTCDGKARGLVFSWYAETSVSNLIKIALLVIGFSWPPIRRFNQFLDKNS